MQLMQVQLRQVTRVTSVRVVVMVSGEACSPLDGRKVMSRSNRSFADMGIPFTKYRRAAASGVSDDDVGLGQALSIYERVPWCQ